MRFKLVIFDWDGTLMDSTDRIVTCMQAAASDLALPPLAHGVVKQIIGLGLPEAISTLYPQLSATDVADMRDRYARHFIAAEATPSALYAGALELLTQLRDAGARLAVATGKSRAGLNRVWQHSALGALFHHSRCADESGSKPDPAMLLHILDALQIHADDAVMIGDTSFDLEMAQRAGVARIGVTYGAHAPEQLLPYQPLALCDSLPALRPYLIATESETQ